jgi:hypothetical protein
MTSSRTILGGSFETCVVPPNPVTRQNKSYNGTAAKDSPNINTKIPESIKGVRVFFFIV